MNKLSGYLAICILAVMTLVSCGPEHVAEAPKDIYWPLPPEKPRIKWLATYATSKDVETESKLVASLVGQEITAALARPQGVAVDSKGNIYVADSSLHKIFVFDVEKKKLRFIGETGDVRPRIPIGLAITEKTNMLLVASAGGKKIIGYDLNSGNIKLTIGDKGTTFKNPVGVAADEERGRIYVTDSKLNELMMFDMAGKYLATIAKGGTADDQLYTPGQVAVDKQGKVYVTDLFNYKLKVYGPDGKFLRTIGLGNGDSPGYFSRVYGVALDSEGHIYAVDSMFCNVQIFDQEARLLLAFGSPGSKPGFMAGPMQMWIDKNDKIYVADTYNFRVQVFQYLKEQ